MEPEILVGRTSTNGQGRWHAITDSYRRSACASDEMFDVRPLSEVDHTNLCHRWACVNMRELGHSYSTKNSKWQDLPVTGNEPLRESCISEK